MEIIDSHQHFWKIDRGDYSWMDHSTAAIQKDYFPKHLEELVEPLGVTSSVTMQAAPTIEETEYLLSLAERSPIIAGVVGWVDLEAADCKKQIERLAMSEKLKGIRPFLEYIDDENWMLAPEVISNLCFVAEIGLAFDALIRPRHFDAMLKFVEALPELRIVIDHCAKPEISGGRDPGGTWRASMKKLAEFDNVYCKFSGLATEVGDDWSEEHLVPVFEHVFSAFGAKRIMWGSDWPVLELVGTYRQWFNAAIDMSKDLIFADREAIFGGTAREFYRL